MREVLHVMLPWLASATRVDVACSRIVLHGVTHLAAALDIGLCPRDMYPVSTHGSRKEKGTFLSFKGSQR